MILKKILVLSFFPSFVPPRSGGELRLFHICRELADQAHVVLLSSSHTDCAEEHIIHAENFIERRVPKDRHFVAEWSRLSEFAGEGDLSAVCVATSARFATPLHLAYLQEYADADFIVHDSPFTVGYDLFIGLDRKPRIYNSYNCESSLFRQLHPESRSAPLHQIVDDCERQLVKHAALVTFCADEDLRAFEVLLGRRPANVLHLPNGTAPRPVVPPAASRTGRLRALFVGSGHLPNVAAAKFIATHLAPACPAIDFDIVGSCLPVGRYAPNVHRHGVVDAHEKARLLSAADVALNPMVSGGGSNLKVLEFFGSAIPVLSTPFGVRGYEVQSGEECLLAELLDFPNALESLRADPTRLRLIGDRGKRAIDGRYGWTAIAGRFLEAIMDLVVDDDRPMAKPYVLGINDYDPYGTTGGGAVRIQGISKAIAQKFPVFYLCFSATEEIEVVRVDPAIVVIKVPKTLLHRRDESDANARFWVSVSDIVAVPHSASNPLLHAVYAILRRGATSIVLDHPYMVELPASFGDAFIYSSQNNETLLKQQVLEWHPDRMHHLAAIAGAESMAVRSSSAVVAVSDEDAESLLRGRSSASPMQVIRNGALEPAVALAVDVETASTTVGERAVAFVGSGHLPNVESAKFIVDRLAGECPEITFHLVGSVCNALSSSLAPNVVAWGQVTDSLKAAILARCAAAINPMFGGGGSNVKLADFIGNGLHVVTTAFGRRGYPSDVDEHVTIASAETFAASLRDVLSRGSLNDATVKLARILLFRRSLSMLAIADDVGKLIQNLRQPKRSVLFATYRWIWPIRGGSEANLYRCVKALADTGRYQIDVVCTDVDRIVDTQRFSASYTPATDCSAPWQLPNVRYRRFPVVERSAQQRIEAARALWLAQPPFERVLYRALRSNSMPTGLAWGWGGVEGAAGQACRWGMYTFGLHLQSAASVTLRLSSPQVGSLRVTDDAHHQLAHVELSPSFTLTFLAEPGALSFEVSASCTLEGDARPLGVLVQEIVIDSSTFDMSRSTLIEHNPVDPAATVAHYDRAAMQTRYGALVELGASRGPHSPPLEEFIEAHAASYDLILTHNPIFRTAQVAVTAARKAGTPSVMLPHAHLDDDFYHFPDVIRAVVDSTAVLAVPRLACDFFQRRGARRVHYFPPGFDTTEAFTDDDESSFRSVWSDDRPFVLVLGRKSPSKGYEAVISAVTRLSAKHRLAVVLIGPDDDGRPVRSGIADYLGAQPRNVVRGALRSCLALVNMSTSESFGMVLLECWLARRPVVVNRHCAAFSDIAQDGCNALLADEDNLEQMIEKLLLTPGLADTLGAAGHETALRFDQQALDREFVEVCDSLHADRAS